MRTNNAETQDEGGRLTRASGKTAGASAETTVVFPQGGGPALHLEQSLGTGEIPNGPQDVAGSTILGSRGTGQGGEGRGGCPSPSEDPTR